ncbi:MAG TPA: helix-turn-helix domain-containing protein [Lacipirellulaceae bacterium]|nr:helix-turn-helix domain-containing protein [Lacipirellulaceae bacterium]
MAQRLMSLEDAANQLGISKDRLNQLREAGKVRAYKDGASWKFRGEDVEKFAAEGLPQIDPQPSGIDLDLDLGDDELELPSSYEKPTKPSTTASEAEESDIRLADEEPETKAGTKPTQPEASASTGSDLTVDLGHEELPAGPASDVSIDDVDEPTVAGIDEGSDDALALDQDDSIDLATDSILMSETELGASTSGRPPSTIIGKADLDLEADLDLSPLDKGSGSGPVSDLTPASESNTVPVNEDDLGLDLPSPSGDFAGLEELEVDLEAESSRILSPEDVAKAQAAAKAASSKKTPESSEKAASSDLELAPTASDPHIAASDIGLGKAGSSGGSPAGLSALELDDDDQVLGEGSDVTLSSESSGINIISPSDSGLALDEVPLDLSGSAPIGSSLDLGMGSSIVEEDSQLEPLAIDIGPESKIGDFQLTPLGEDEGDEEKDSSQVIALDEISEETASEPIAAGLSEAGMMTEDFGLGLTPGAAPVGVMAAAGTDTQFSLWNVLALGGCIFLLLICGMMTYDLLRNMWSWGGVTTINHSLLDSVSSVLGK